ncbi:hypothetical protein BN107_000036 [Lactobacillus phage phiAQ113]|uniref:hypothetical protein n=1 Tax=Lactobacillus phage phiAQ113 TaxID=1206110 RepID=UPI00029FBF0D|nr:hypothetical protein BN107_000036 [Lactobacillus phage phiAQ113]CCI88350.1 unnamed protein product [Lactobacillus phage phiAQ113]
MEYTVRQIEFESKKYVEKISKTIEEKEKELKKYETYLDKVDDTKILDIEETQVEDEAELLKLSLSELYKERTELQKCEDFCSSLEDLTSNLTYDGQLYLDDDLSLHSLGSEPTYELAVDLKNKRFYIYRPADTKAVWLTLDEIKVLVSKVLDDTLIKEASRICYSSQYKKLLESNETARIANFIEINNAEFSSKNLAKLSKAVEMMNPERKQFLASALINVKSEYEEYEYEEI